MTTQMCRFLRRAFLYMTHVGDWSSSSYFLADSEDGSNEHWTVDRGRGVLIWLALFQHFFTLCVYKRSPKDWVGLKVILIKDPNCILLKVSFIESRFIVSWNFYWKLKVFIERLIYWKSFYWRLKVRKLAEHFSRRPAEKTIQRWSLFFIYESRLPSDRRTFSDMSARCWSWGLSAPIFDRAQERTYCKSIELAVTA
jgi:hypothetical protein